MTLGFIARGLVQGLGAHLIVSTLLSLAVLVVWRRVATAQTRASVTARRLFALRAVPSVGGLVTGSLVALGYVIWEPRVEHEPVGWAALVAAVGGAVVVVAAALRVVTTSAYTSRLRRVLVAARRGTLSAEPLQASMVETVFPVVAIVGLTRPTLFVARSVVEACSPAELDAVLAHELAHARQHDNLRRLVMVAAPDWLGLGPGGRQLDASWRQAAEFAADESAAAGRDGAVHLAAALVKVARLAVSPPDPMPASALYQGDPIAERVRRLLDPPAARDERPWPAWARGWILVAALGLAVAAVPALHRAAEYLLALGR